MAAHCSILAWRTPWTEEPLGSQRVKYDWAIEHITHMSLHFSSPLLLLIMEMGHLVTTMWLRYDWIWFYHIWYVLVYFTKNLRPWTITLRLRTSNSNQEARRDHKESFEMSIWAGKSFHQIKTKCYLPIQEVNKIWMTRRIDVLPDGQRITDTSPRSPLFWKTNLHTMVLEGTSVILFFPHDHTLR